MVSRKSSSQANGHADHASNVAFSIHADTSPVLQAVMKRIRNARKRLRGIDEIQAKRDAGKELNPDQVGFHLLQLSFATFTHRVAVRRTSPSPAKPSSLITQEAALLSRSGVVAIIEELERLMVVLEEPLKEELGAAAAKAEEQAIASITATKSSKTDEEWKAEMDTAISSANASNDEVLSKMKLEMEAKSKQAQERNVREAVNSLMEMLYLGTALDPYNPYNHERHACLAYATMAGSKLTAEALDVVGFISKLLITRPFGATVLSHKDTLVACQQAALRFVTEPAAQVHAGLPGVSGKQVRETLKAIKALDFYAIVPANVPTGLGPIPSVVAPAASAPPTPAVAAAPAVAVPLVVPPISAVSQPAVPVRPLAVPVAPQPSSHGDRTYTARDQRMSNSNNIVEKIFGPNRSYGAAGAPQHTRLSAVPPQDGQGAAAGPSANSSEPPAFAGDSELGIEGVELEENKKIVANVNPTEESAPPPSAVPPPTFAPMAPNAGRGPNSSRGARGGPKTGYRGSGRSGGRVPIARDQNGGRGIGGGRGYGRGRAPVRPIALRQTEAH